MAEYAVNTAQLRTCADQISALQRQLDSVAVRLGAMQLGSVMKMNASTALIARVGDCKWAAANQSNDLGRLARGLTDVASLYENCETNLKEPKTLAQAVHEYFQDALGAAGIAGAVVNNSDIGGKVVGAFRQVLGWGKNCVPIGIASAIWNFTDGNVKSTLKGVKGIVDAVGTGTKAIFNTANGGINADWAKKLFGLGPNTGHGWAASWAKFKKDHSWGQQTTSAGKAGVVAKWAGYALTAAINGVENYDEYKEGGISAGRAVGETVLESAVDIGLGIGAGIIAVAALPATAPAIAVGAVSAAAVWAVNGVCKWATGKDVGEVVADAVCDTAEKVVNVAKDVGKGIKEGAKAAWSGFCSLFG